MYWDRHPTTIREIETLAKPRKYKKRKFSTEVTAKIVDLRLQGKTFEDIGEVIDLSRETVRKRYFEDSVYMSSVLTVILHRLASMPSPETG